MSLELALTLAGLLCITVGSVFYFISLLMERYYDRKLAQLDREFEKLERNFKNER